MKKIAIITPCMLPVPSTNGGAVETLITEILNTNEICNDLDIDVYSMSFSDAYYANTAVITVHKTRLLAGLDRVIDKICRSLAGFNISAVRAYDNAIVSAFSKRINEGIHYDAIVVENMMSIARKIIKCKGKLYDCPVYFHMHNNVDIYRSPKMIKILDEAGVKFIAVSEYIKKEITDIVPDADVSVLYNGVNEAVFNRDVAVNKLKLRQELGINATDIIFQYSGRIIAEKGVEELIKAFSELCNEDPAFMDSVKLNIIGVSDETQTAYEKSVVSHARDNNHINLIKRQEAADMAKYYAIADAVIIPSVFDEPFGMVALEAMAMGKPVIATDAGGLPEILSDSFTEMVTRDELVNKLKLAIYKLLKEGSLEKKGEMAYGCYKARHEFNKDSFYSNFVSLIK